MTQKQGLSTGEPQKISQRLQTPFAKLSRSDTLKSMSSKYNKHCISYIQIRGPVKKQQAFLVILLPDLRGFEFQAPFAMKPGTPVSITELSLLRI